MYQRPGDTGKGAALLGRALRSCGRVPGPDIGPSFPRPTWVIGRMAGTPPPDPPQFHPLRLRYPGTCIACGAVLPKGTDAMRDPASRKVRCIECPGSEATAGWAGIDEGVAGRSAAAKHDRLVARREERVTDRWGRNLGRVVLALTEEPASTKAWASGAAGEEALGRALDGLADVTVLHDRQVPRTRGNIDHLVIAPAGIFVVDAKNHRGLVAVRDRGGFFRTDLRLYVGGRDHSDLADGMGWQVDAVRVTLAVSRLAELAPVTPVLCFTRADWPWFRPPTSFRGVRLEGPTSLRRLVCGPRVIGAETVAALVRIVATAFPPK